MGLVEAARLRPLYCLAVFSFYGMQQFFCLHLWWDLLFLVAFGRYVVVVAALIHFLVAPLAQTSRGWSLASFLGANFGSESAL